MKFKLTKEMNEKYVVIEPVIVRSKGNKESSFQYHSGNPADTNYAVVVKHGCGYKKGSLIYINLGGVSLMGGDTLSPLTYIDKHAITGEVVLEKDEEFTTLIEYAKEIAKIKLNKNDIITNNKIGGEGITTSRPGLILK